MTFSIFLSLFKGHVQSVTLYTSSLKYNYVWFCIHFKCMYGLQQKQLQRNYRVWFLDNNSKNKQWDLMKKHFILNYITSCNTTIRQSLAIISVQSGRFCLYHFTSIHSPILETPLLRYVFSPIRSVLFILHTFHQFWSQAINNYTLRTGHVLSFSLQHAVIALWRIRIRQNSD